VGYCAASERAGCAFAATVGRGVSATFPGGQTGMFESWRYEDEPRCVCPTHGPMTRAYYGDRLAFIACRVCNRTPTDVLLANSTGPLHGPTAAKAIASLALVPIPPGEIVPTAFDPDPESHG
jgi:hypothetical protein